MARLVIVSSVGALLVIGLAGLLGGTLNAVSTGGTLVTYPALLLVGTSALEANATSAVGLLVGYITGAVAYRRELRESEVTSVRMPLLALVGAIAGTSLLLSTNEAAFRRVAPLLVLFATVLLIAQPRIARVIRSGRATQPPGSSARLGDAAVIGCGVYGAYFGAGMGVLVMGVVGSFIPMSFQAVNAWKNLLSFIIACAATLILAFSGLVIWSAALGIAAASAVGAVAGVWIARRLAAWVLRWGTVALGLSLASALMISG